VPDIVVRYDGSVNAMCALEWAMQHAALQHATLTVLAVNEVAASPWTGNPAVMPSCRHAVMPQDAVMLQQARTAAENAVAKVVSEHGDTQPPTLKVTVMNGFAVQELINASCDAEVLVVGSRGQLGFPALGLGATSTKITNCASCPIVILPPAS
jgi:nucleotide-binding universal stress UspA family protein